MNLERVYERWEQKTLARGRREGKAEGKAAAVIAVLESRGLPVSAAQRRQVLGCTDDAQLDRWLRLATSTPGAKELLAVRAASRARTR